jgi:hypothetical protein
MPVPEMSFAAPLAISFRLAAFVSTCACEIDVQPNQAMSW